MVESKMQNEEIFLDLDKCNLYFAKKHIFVFGTGVDAEQFVKKMSSDIYIIAHIDNNRSGKGHYFYGKNIIGLEECLEQRDSKQPIIVCSYRYAKEISNQLAKFKLMPGIDFFVWDDMFLFHYDMNTKNYIYFLSNIWKKYDKESCKNKILIPFDNRHDLMSTIYAYCSNFFAEKFDAEIVAYFRKGSDCSNVSEVIESIYKAFNVKAVVNTKLNKEQQCEAEKILVVLWEGLYTWEDWKKITIYGIHFGTTIMRDFLREYIPDFDLRSRKMYHFLKKTIQTIVFWYHYIFENDVKIVLLADGVTWDGYIRDIAITKGIPTYALCYKMAKMTLDYCDRPSYPYFKEMWKQLTREEQEYGIKWAKEHIKRRLCGGTEEVSYADKKNFVFAEGIKENIRVLNDNDKIKIIICPHVFEEDGYWCGEHIFDDNQFAWLCHLGELSEKTPEYDWYLKMHPSAKRRDIIIIDMLLEKFSPINKIPSNISPIQLKEEGAEFALTIYGSIGHEYPEIGIQVINAGINPHCAFDFTWNPKTKEEYDNLILNLGNLGKKRDEEGLYQFYSLNYLYYNWDYIPYRTLFFENPLLSMDMLELQVNGKELGSWKYKMYIEEWTEERHERILFKLDKIFKKMDGWSPKILYRRKERAIEQIE